MIDPIVADAVQSPKGKRHVSFKVAARKVFFFLHLWLGLIVGLYFSVIGLTGSVLVFREDWEAHRTMPERTYVAPPNRNAPLMPLSDIIARLQNDYPEAKPAELAFVNPPARDGGAYIWRLTQNKRALSTTINPYTGATIGRYDTRHTFLSWVDDLHTDLLFREPGRLMNGYGGLLSGVILLSGLWLWWPQTRKQIKIRYTVKRGAGAARVIADLHNVMGSYLFLLLLVVTLSGAVIVFSRQVQTRLVAWFGSSRVPRAPRIAPPTSDQKPLPAGDLLRVAQNAAPNSHFVFVLYPTRKNQPVYAYTRSETGLLPDTRIYVNPYTGAVAQTGRDISDPRSKQILRANASLHFGRWGGWPIKILYGICGLLPLGLFVTGILMSVRRWRSQAAQKNRRRQKQIPTSPAA